VDPIGFLIVAIVVVAVIALVARRWAGGGGDVADGRGPYSTEMEARGGFAALGTTLDQQRNRPPDDPPAADRIEDA
jgi:hypothetical protein